MPEHKSRSEAGSAIDVEQPRKAADARRPMTTTTRRRFYVLLGAMSAAGVVALGFVASPHPVSLSLAETNVDSALVRDARGYRMGRADAPVTIVEYADFQCPGCAQFATRSEPEIRRELIEPGYASFTFMDMPLSVHANAWPAHNAAACAGGQGKFWEMHDRLFHQQSEWSEQAPGELRRIFTDYARALRLDITQWKKCISAGQFERRIRANRAEALKRGVRGTPTVFVNGRAFTGGNVRTLKAIVDSITRSQVVAKAPDTGDSGVP